jgi:hypothetical protein
VLVSGRLWRWRRMAPRALLISLLMFGTVVMHHVSGVTSEPVGLDHVAAPADPGASHAHAAPTDADPAHSPAHQLAHLCLAVLSGAVLALALWVLHFPLLVPALARHAGQLWRCAAFHPPRRSHGFTLLLSLGVIRV